MQRSRPAEGGEHEITRIVAALHGYDLEHFCHRVVDHVDDRGRRGAHINAERLGKPVAHGGFGCPMIDAEVAVEQ